MNKHKFERAVKTFGGAVTALTAVGVLAYGTLAPKANVHPIDNNEVTVQTSKKNDQKDLSKQLAEMPISVTAQADNAQMELSKLDFSAAANSFLVAAYGAKQAGSMEVAAYYGKEAVNALATVGNDYVESNPKVAITYYKKASSIAMGLYLAGFGDKFVSYMIENMKMEENADKNAANEAYHTINLGFAKIGIGNEKQANVYLKEAAKEQTDINSLEQLKRN